jgi:MFS family permease
MADKYPKMKDRTTERYADSIIIGFLLSFIWPPIFWVAVVLVVAWFVGVKILIPLFYPERRKKKAKKSE